MFVLLVLGQSDIGLCTATRITYVAFAPVVEPFAAEPYSALTTSPLFVLVIWESELTRDSVGSHFFVLAFLFVPYATSLDAELKNMNQFVREYDILTSRVQIGRYANRDDEGIFTGTFAN